MCLPGNKRIGCLFGSSKTADVSKGTVAVTIYPLSVCFQPVSIVPIGELYFIETCEKRLQNSGRILKDLNPGEVSVRPQICSYIH